MDGASTHQELDQAFARTVELDDARDVRPSVRRRASRRRYERSEKGRARSRRYDMTWKGCQRHRRYDRTANGRRRKIDYDVRRGRDPTSNRVRLRSGRHTRRAGRHFRSWTGSTR